LSRLREWFFDGFLITASVVLTLLAVEGGARAYRRMRPQPPNNRYSFRLARPAPYREAWYFSPEFVDETFRQPNGWHIPPNTRLLVPGDFHGRYVNVEHGQRRTTDSPAVARHTLFVIGGSAIYAAEVPDRETIPSHLQRLLNARQPGEWRVENYGTVSVTTAQQVELLRTLPVRRGDLVVFYDGVNDVYQGIYNGDPGGWVAGENRKQLKGAGLFKAALVKINAKYAASKVQSYSVFAGTVLGNLVNGQNLIRKPHLNDPGKVAALARETAEVFRANLTEADRLTKERGARFVHFLQPQIFGQTRRTSYEDAVVSNFYINPNGLETAFMAGYPLLREAVPGVASFDLSGVLDERQRGEEFYLDFCHVNHVANARIAGAIMARLHGD
jgi:hypothetical protein